MYSTVAELPSPFGLVSDGIFMTNRSHKRDLSYHHHFVVVLSETLLTIMFVTRKITSDFKGLELIMKPTSL